MEGENNHKPREEGLYAWQGNRQGKEDRQKGGREKGKGRQKNKDFLRKDIESLWIVDDRDRKEWWKNGKNY